MMSSRAKLLVQLALQNNQQSSPELLVETNDFGTEIYNKDTYYDIIKHRVYINEFAPSKENRNSELNLCYEDEADYSNDTSFDSNDSNLTLQTIKTRKNMMQLKNPTIKVNLDVLIRKDQTVSRKNGPKQASHGNAERKSQKQKRNVSEWKRNIERTNEITITGNTQNERDGMYFCIERERSRVLKSGLIYLPCQWIPITRLAKKNVKSSIVQQLDTSDVYD
ncbi:hypothetical protein ILUMI_25504 [Ignelater luminosus]|uniref:Uncharacterized protein n=1 Tax=Ignelater luminosus TaxID=2038154 RepID=A0A8K0FW80_IGNLU|nr:hypothetical protein ILUMI_25504 [Ignelater luminosus]